MNEHAPAMQPLVWNKEGRYYWRTIGDTGYTIAEYRVGHDVKFRPSKGTRFIADFCASLQEAQQICANNHIVTAGMPD